MKNRLGILTIANEDYYGASGGGGGFVYNPEIRPVQEYTIDSLPKQEFPVVEMTPIEYPQIIENISTTQMPEEVYLPEEFIDSETPVLTATNDDVLTVEEPPTKVSDWIKANKGLVIAGGAGLFLLLANKKKKKVGKLNPRNKRLLLAGAAAVGIYFLMKKKQPVEPVIEEEPTTTFPVIDEPQELPQTAPSNPYAYSESDRSYYEQMWRLLSNNYLYQEHPYDYPFAGEVLKEYKFIVDGHPTSSQWNIGVPGAFMVMLDRWYRYYLTDSKKRIFLPTLYQIGELYKAYVNQISTL